VGDPKLAQKGRKRWQRKDEPSGLTPRKNTTSGSHCTQNLFRDSSSSFFLVWTLERHLGDQLLCDVRDRVRGKG